MMEAVVRALAGLLVSIELSSDDVLDSDAAALWLDDVVADLDGLSEGDRRRIADMIRGFAELETDPERRAVIEELPDGLGLM